MFTLFGTSSLKFSVEIIQLPPPLICSTRKRYIINNKLYLIAFETNTIRINNQKYLICKRSKELNHNTIIVLHRGTE